MSNEIKDLTETAVANLEYNLQIVHRTTIGDRECAGYLVRNRRRIFGKLLEKARAEKRDSDAVVCEFANEIHKRHQAGKPLT